MQRRKRKGKINENITPPFCLPSFFYNTNYYILIIIPLLSITLNTSNITATTHHHHHHHLPSSSPPVPSVVATRYTTVVSPAVDEAVTRSRCHEAEARSQTPKSVVSSVTRECRGVQATPSSSLPNSTCRGTERCWCGSLCGSIHDYAYDAAHRGVLFH